MPCVAIRLVSAMLCATAVLMRQVVVENAAFDAGLAIRTGCMCNPGQCHFNLGIRPEEVRDQG
jgi:hypothetical protein